MIAAQGATRGGSGSAWRRRAVALAVLVAAVVPVVGLGWFVVYGPGELEDTRDTGIPAYMMQSAGARPRARHPRVDGDVETGFTWSVLRDDGLTVGEDEIVGLMAADDELDALVGELVSSPASGAVESLPEQGIEYVVLPDPADGNVAAVLDATTGLEQASAENRETRAWQVAEEVTPGRRRQPGVVAAARAGDRPGRRDPRRPRAVRAEPGTGAPMSTTDARAERPPHRRAAAGSARPACWPSCCRC